MEFSARGVGTAWPRAAQNKKPTVIREPFVGGLYNDLSIEKQAGICTRPVRMGTIRGRTPLINLLKVF